MHTVIIYGSSDDLIEVDGDRRAEFYTLNDEDNFVCCSDGTVLQFIYNADGMWRITTVRAGTASLEISPGTDLEDDYSDRAVLTGDVEEFAFETDLDAALDRVVG